MVNHDRRDSFLDSNEGAAVIASGVDVGDLSRPTPCPKDDVAHLVDHTVEAGHRAAAAGRGMTPSPARDYPHVALSHAVGHVRPAGEYAARTWDDVFSRSPTFNHALG